jgi:putative oxidoreductase
MTSLLRHQIVLLLLRVFTGGIFIYAPLDKIVHASGFSDSVWNYHMLPQAMVNLWALWLPWLELFLGILILIGIWSIEATVLVNFLYVLFLIAIGQGLARGIDFECGCFSQGGRASAATWSTILRDVWFFVMSIWLLWAERRQSTWSLVKEIQSPDILKD